MHTSRDVPASLQQSAGERTLLRERCRTCTNLEIDGQGSRDFFDKRQSMKSNTAQRKATLRQARSTPNLRTSVLHTVRRLRRGKRSEEEDGVSAQCTCEATTLAQSATPEVGVHKKAMRVVSGIINMRRQPETSCQDIPSVPQLHSGVPKVSKPNSNEDGGVEQHGLAQPCGGVGIVSSSGFDTAIAHGHSAAATPDRQSNRRSTYIDCATKQEVGNSFRVDGPMMLRLETTMIDLESDLEWFDSEPTVHRDFSAQDRRTQRETVNHSYGSRVPGQEMGEESVGVATEDPRVNQEVEGWQMLHSLPELDREYQSSDSGLSTMEELIAQQLTLSRSMHDLLLKDTDGQVGSFYSLSSNTGKPDANALPDEMNWMDGDCNAQVSRFSLDSSICSDPGGDALEEERVWWRPRPLNIFKELGPAPPVPERNPLRLMKRLSKNFPKGFGNNVRRSRNIHNLHLDLSETSRGDRRTSWRTSGSPRKRSQIPNTKQKSKADGESFRPNQVLPSHILHAMRSPTHITEATEASRDKKRSGRGARTSYTSKTGPSTKGSNSQSSHAKQLKEARGHIRANSDPLGESDMDRSISCKWNEAMPSHDCIRRTCITGLANEVRPMRSVPTLAINKQLPPLPVTLDS